MKKNLLVTANAILGTADPGVKAEKTLRAVKAWQIGEFIVGPTRPPPAERPARPAKPTLLPPRDMPRRRANGSPASRVALLHAIAHIELNAIDLAWDLIVRFGHSTFPHAFFDDWVKIAGEEAVHFQLLSARLVDLDARYGDLPAHDGLWQAAVNTSHDLLARLAIVPLVLEARGLDVTPAMISRLEQVDDLASVEILRRIYEDEIGHVAIGRRWFGWTCHQRGLAVRETWQKLVKDRYGMELKKPFNHAARHLAGLTRADYLPLASAVGSNQIPPTG